jgi:hypothetical protein
MSRILGMWDHDEEVSDEFFEWLEASFPGEWDTAYSGDIYGMWSAWEAGRKYERSNPSS